MSGFGALLGMQGIFWAALWTAGVGGVLALAVIAVKAVQGQVRSGIRKQNDGEKNGDQRESIPYAPAIALGVWLSLVPKG